MSIDLRSEVGLKLTPGLGLGFVAGYHYGMSSASTNEWPSFSEFGVTTVGYPFSDSGLRLDATASVAPLSYGFDNYDIGPLFGAGIGYDDGDRSKTTKALSWTGFSVALRGLYRKASGHESFGGSLSFGGHAW